MWRELAAEAGLRTAEPASPKAVRAIEETLGCILPDSLRELLLETNGLTGEYELEVVMSAEEIAKENASMRSTEDFVELYMPFDHLLFFGRAGNGDLFRVPDQRPGGDRPQRLHLGPRGRQPRGDQREPGALRARRELA